MQISDQKADELWKRTGCIKVQITSLRHLCFVSRSSNPPFEAKRLKKKMGDGYVLWNVLWKTASAVLLAASTQHVQKPSIFLLRGISDCH